MKNTTLQRLLFSRFLAALSDQLMLFVVPVIIYTQTQSVALSGLAFFIEWTPRVLSLPLAGSLCDSIGSKKVYLSADFIRASVALIVFSVLLVLQDYYFVILSTFMAISAFFYAQSYIALESVVPKIVAKELLPKAQSRLQAIEQGSMILGPILGAGIISIYDPVHVLLFGAILYAIAYLFTLTIHLPETATIHKLKISDAFNRIKKDVVRASGIVIRRRSLILMTCLSVNINLIFGVVLATAAALTTGYFDKEVTHFGIIQSVSGFLVLLCLMVLPHLLKLSNIFYLGIISYLCVVACGFLMSIFNNFYVYAICYCTILSIGSWFNIYIRTERALWIPKLHLGKTIGFIVFLNQLTLPLSGLLVSFTNSERQILMMLGLLSLMALTTLFLFFYKLKSDSRVLLTANG